MGSMVEWLNLTPGVRLARTGRFVRFSVVAVGFAACFILALVL
jgi:hypothetical protein